MDEFNGLLGMGLGFFSVSDGFAIAFYAIWLKSKAREMRHREHMAMIEKDSFRRNRPNHLPSVTSNRSESNAKAAS